MVQKTYSVLEKLDCSWIFAVEHIRVNILNFHTKKFLRGGIFGIIPQLYTAEHIYSYQNKTKRIHNCLSITFSAYISPLQMNKMLRNFAF